MHGAKGIQAVLKYDGWRGNAVQTSLVKGAILHVLNCVKWEYISSWFLLVLSNIINDSTFVTDAHHPVIRRPLFHQSLCMKSD